MTVAALIGLEERERIDDLRARGRRLDDAHLIRSVLTPKAEALSSKQSDWEQTLARKPGAPRGWGSLTPTQIDNINRILEINRREREQAEAAKAALKVPAKRRRRRRSRR
jgi:hypothetical protein